MTDLTKHIKQAQIQREQLLEEYRELYQEKLLVQAENRFFLEYLTNKTEEYTKQPEKVWNSYLQKSGEIERRRQESASRYAEQISVLKTALLQKENIQSSLKRKLQAMRDIAILKEKQEKEIQTLQEEKKKVQAETAAKTREVQAQLLQEKRLLEKQLSEPDRKLLGKRKRSELNKKAQALKLAAKRSIFEYSCGLKRENQQFKKELLQLIEQAQKLTATQSHLENRKQQLQQEQWYLESLIRGRQRLQGSHNQCLNRQDGPKTTPSLPQGTKSRIHPK
ncbi:coiled-coil domain-containing protein 121 isoform X2 [Trachypithecus francoisi]|nr:coiled-coil domain-containing protein 121 isoform X2 [Trachypithecus francoisi]